MVCWFLTIFLRYSTSPFFKISASKTRFVKFFLQKLTWSQSVNSYVVILKKLRIFQLFNALCRERWSVALNITKLSFKIKLKGSYTAYSLMVNKIPNPVVVEGRIFFLTSSKNAFLWDIHRRCQSQRTAWAGRSGRCALSAVGGGYREHHCQLGAGQRRCRAALGRVSMNGTREGFLWVSKEQGHRFGIGSAGYME